MEMKIGLIRGNSSREVLNMASRVLNNELNTAFESYIELVFLTGNEVHEDQLVN